MFQRLGENRFQGEDVGLSEEQTQIQNNNMGWIIEDLQVGCE